MAAMFLITAAIAATAMQPTAVAGAQAAPARPNPEQRIMCRREESVGTRLSARTCMTRAQWRQRDADNREAARGLVEDSERDGRQGANLSGEGSSSISPN